MTSRFYGLPGLALVAVLCGSCKEDPTASLAGDVAAVELEFSHRVVAVDDSALVRVIVRDALHRPLRQSAAVTSCNAIATVTPAVTPSGLVETRFYVKAASFGNGCARATVGSFSDSMGVEAVPAALVVAGPTTLASGVVQVFTATFRSATNRDITAQFPAAKWSVDSAPLAVIDSVTGSLTGRDFGVVNVTAAGSGTTGLRAVSIQPAPFLGALTPGTAAPSSRVRIDRGTGTAFDGDERVFVNRVAIGALTPTSVFERVLAVTPDSIVFQLDDLRAAGAYEIVVNRVGTSQLSTGGDSLTVSTPALAGTVTPNPVDPGGTIRITPGAGLTFDADTRVYVNNVLAAQASNTPDSIKVNIANLDTAGTRTLRLTRIGAANDARTGTFAIATPASFAGTVSPSASGAAVIVAIARAAADPAFDSDVAVFFKRVGTFVARQTADTVYAVVPALGIPPDTLPLLITKIGAGQVARLGTFTTTTFKFDDPYDAVNPDNDPTAGPPITQDGDYFVVVHGQCSNGAGGTDCDDFFTIANPQGVTDSVTVRLDWASNADVDLLWCNAACSAFVGNFQGATGANPETSRVNIPANTTWRLWINLFLPGSVNASLVRVRVTGLGVAP